MKIAYKALYHQVLCEKEELVVRTEQLTDRLIDENIKMRNEVEYYRAISIGIATSSVIICTTLIYWLAK